MESATEIASHWVRLLFATYLPGLRERRAGGVCDPAAARRDIVAAVRRQAGPMAEAAVLVEPATAAPPLGNAGELLVEFGRASLRVRGEAGRPTLLNAAGVANQPRRVAAAALLVTDPEQPRGVRRHVAVTVTEAGELATAAERALSAIGSHRAALAMVLSATADTPSRQRESDALTVWQPQLPLIWLVARVGEVGAVLDLLTLLAAVEEPGPQLVVATRPDRCVIVAVN